MKEYPLIRKIANQDSMKFNMRASGYNQAGSWRIDIFSSVPRPPGAAQSPGLLISRSYGRVMPARFASRLANRRAVPPPSLFPSHPLGAIGSPIP